MYIIWEMSPLRTVTSTSEYGVPADFTFWGFIAPAYRIGLNLLGWDAVVRCYEYG
jgi:hypothetical protein